jgi:ankyrin repeat protein
MDYVKKNNTKAINGLFNKYPNYDVKKINVNVRRESGLTPLMEAIKWGRKDVAMMLIGDERYLRKKGLKVRHPRYLADVNAETNYFMTSLMFAARGKNNIDIVRALLRAGANKSARDSKKRTAYDHAKLKRNKNYLRLLRP